MLDAFGGAADGVVDGRLDGGGVGSDDLDLLVDVIAHKRWGLAASPRPASRKFFAKKRRRGASDALARNLHTRCGATATESNEHPSTHHLPQPLQIGRAHV